MKASRYGSRALSSTLALAALGVALAAPGCESGTGGRMITFRLELAAEPDPGRPLGSSTTATGWEVTLEEAWAAVGPVFVHENAGALARDDRPLPLRWLVPLAHAHPGDSHYDGGVVKGEWLGQALVDLLDPTSFPAFEAPGIAGTARSLTVHLEPPRASLAGRERLRGHHLYVAGVAERDGAVVPFEGGLDLSAEGDQREVQGVPLTGALDDGVTLVVAAHPSTWFLEARFEELLGGEPGEGGRYPIAPGSQVERAWYIGARSLAPPGAPGSAFTAQLAGEEEGQ